MSKNEANSILCLLCSKDKENIEHFIMDCERLEEVRKPILQEIEEILNDKETSWKCLPQDTTIQLLLDITSVISKLNLDPASIANIEYCSLRHMPASVANIEYCSLRHMPASVANIEYCSLRHMPASVANIEYCSRCLMFQLHMLRQTRILDMQGTIKQQGCR
jgi:hypothetical protein